MGKTITIDVDPQHEGIVRRALALAEEMEQLALTAPEGQVFDTCEEAIIEKGRKLQGAVLGEAVARRLEAIEKKGRRSVSAPADATKKTADPKNVP
jgi:DNA replication initiation complex subunit (GINS family)